MASYDDLDVQNVFSLTSDGLRLTPFAGQVELLVSRVSVSVPKGAFNNYVDKVKGGGGQKMSVFVHVQRSGYNNCRGRGQNSVHVVVE